MGLKSACTHDNIQDMSNLLTVTKPQSTSKIITNRSDFITNLPTCRHILKQGPFSLLVEITHESLTQPEN